MNNHLLKFEHNLYIKGIELIAGIDEVGRGALAGPMVVSAVIINPKHLKEYTIYSEEYPLYTQINDSKKISIKKRMHIAEFLHDVLYSYSIVEVSHLDIDKYGLTHCTQVAFEKAIHKLHTKPDHILTDSYEIKKITKESQTNIVAGDTKSISIAAASIIAKVYRDNLMIELHDKHDKYKIYGFNKHKGYGTVFHREMIKKHGYSDLHRLSYKINLDLV